MKPLPEKEKSYDYASSMLELIHRNDTISELKTGKKISLKRAVEILNIKKHENKKTTEVVGRRYLFWRFVYDLNYHSLAKIGELTGHDHATVLHGLRQVEAPGSGWLERFKLDVKKVTDLIDVTIDV